MLTPASGAQGRSRNPRRSSCFDVAVLEVHACVRDRRNVRVVRLRHVHKHDMPADHAHALAVGPWVLARDSKKGAVLHCFGDGRHFSVSASETPSGVCVPN